VLAAAVVCPFPPVMVPEVASGATVELADLSAACDEAVGRLLAADVDLLVVVGPGDRSESFPADAWGTLAPYGVDVVVGGEGSPVLPLSLTLGAWLLRRAGWSGPGGFQAVDAALDSGRCAALGADLARRADRVGMLVMGDGSACRSEKAPGYFDERAGDFDARAAKALGGGDVAALLGLDGPLAAELMAAGRPAWQVLAGAAGDRPYDAELLYDDAPYGVGYFVAVWGIR